MLSRSSLTVVTLLAALLCVCNAETWCVNAGITQLNVRTGSTCNSAPAFQIGQGTCLTRYSTTTCSYLGYPFAQFYYGSSIVWISTSSQFMYRASSSSPPSPPPSPPPPPPPPSGGSCSGSSGSKIRANSWALSGHVGNLYCSPWDSTFCGQCTHYIWQVTGNRQNVGQWKKIETVSSAISGGRISKGDVIATFNGAYSPCGYGGHVAIFDYYDSANNRIWVYHQNWNYNSHVTHTVIGNFGDYYTVASAGSKKREETSVVAVHNDAPPCVTPGMCDLPEGTCSEDSDCDDENPCTVDTCQSGTCASIGTPCPEPTNQCTTVELVQVDDGSCECVTAPLDSPQPCSVECANDGICLEGRCIAATRCETGSETEVSVSACTYPTTRYNLSYQKDAAAMQWLLTELRYLSGSDGIFGSGTESAVKRFQNSVYLTADGVCGPATWKKLIDTIPGSRVNSYSARGHIGAAQAATGSSADGLWGPNTEAAIRNRQSALGLPVTGYVDNNSWAALLGTCSGGGGTTYPPSGGGGGKKVSDYVSSGCTTSVLKGLNEQIIKQVNCRSGSPLFSRIDDLRGATFSNAAASLPFIQTPCKAPLQRALNERSQNMQINSALRTVAQQLLLYRWYQVGRCGIPIAARPGRSNHNRGAAIDIANASSWLSALTGNSYSKLANDPPHYDYAGSSVSRDAISSLQVEGFQRLWNANNPSDQITVDGDYGPTTERKLLASPAGGFSRGNSCL